LERCIEIRSFSFEHIPQVTKKLTVEQVDEVEKLLETIEKDNEVQNVFLQNSAVKTPES